MTVKELKELLVDAPDEMQVLIALNHEFDGAFVSPCTAESGVSELGTEDLDEEEIKEHELLNKPVPSEKSFVIVRHGFFEEHEGAPPELN